MFKIATTLILKYLRHLSVNFITQSLHTFTAIHTKPSYLHCDSHKAFIPSLRFTQSLHTFTAIHTKPSYLHCDSTKTCRYW